MLEGAFESFGRRFAKYLPVFVGKSAELPKTVLCRDGGHPCDGGIGLQQSASYRMHPAKQEVLARTDPELHLTGGP